MHALVQAVRDLAAASPDNHYYQPNPVANSCYYAKGRCDNGSVGCIVGQAIRALGYDPAIIDAAGPRNARHAIGYLKSECTRRGIDAGRLNGLEEGDLNWIVRVQDRQDAGKSWDEAVNLADGPNAFSGSCSAQVS